MAWLAGWSGRKKITIDRTNVGADLTNFPLYSYFNADADIGARALASGNDIRFTQSDGTTLLKYEPEYWNVAGGAATAHFWTKVPTVTTAANAEIYIYYGNAGAAAGADPPNVWDAFYSAVWHLAEAGNPYMDSTVNNNDSNAGTYPAQVNGQIYKGQDFETTSSHYIRFADAATLDFGTGDFTISFCTKPESMAYEFIIAKNNSDAPKWFIEWTDGPSLFADIRDGAAHEITVVSTATFSAATMYHVTLVCDRDSATGFKFFINGTVDAATANPTTVGSLDNASPVFMGSSDVQDGFLDGILDEVRISKTLRSPSWIHFEYHNMFEADHEITIGPHESAPAGDHTVFFGSNF